MAATIIERRTRGTFVPLNVGVHAGLCILLVLAFCSSFPDLASAAFPYVDPENQETIIWGDLPPIPEATNQSSLAPRPATLARMAEGFVDLVQPQGIPFDYVTFVLENVLYNDTNYYQENWQTEIWKIMGLFVGIVVCLVFGILYCLIVPTTGFFFSCCRCCNRCGGKRVQRETKHMGCKRVTLSLLFFSITGIICAGMAFTNVSNEFMQDSVIEVKVIVDSSLENMKQYLDGANEQLDYMVKTEYVFMDNLYRDNLENIGEKIGDPVEEYLLTDAGLQDVIDSVNNISSTLSGMETALVEIDSLQMSLASNSTLLQDELDGVQSNLQAINAECSNCVPDIDKLRVTANFSLLPALESQVKGVQSANSIIANITQEIDSILDKIPAQISTQTQDSVQEAILQLDVTAQEVNESFSAVSEVVSDFSSQLSKAKDYVDNVWGDAEVYAQYFYYGLIGLTCTVLLIVMFNLIGMTMGTFSYKSVLPTERSRMSNAGGNVLMAGVFFTFLFAPILMILTCVAFLGLSSVTLLCEPLLTYQAFNETIDQPNVIVDGYFLGNLVLGNSSIPLTVTGILTDCEQDASAYSAFQLQTLYDLSGIEDQLDGLQAEVDKLIEEINPDEIKYDFPFTDFIDELNKLVDMTELANINYTLFNEVLSQSITAVNLTEYAMNLIDIGATNQNVEANLTAQANTLLTIQSNIVDPMQQSVNKIQSNLDLIQLLESLLGSQINTTIDAVSVAEASIASNETTNAVVNISAEYADRLIDYGYQFFYQIEHQITEDFARCELVASVYAYSVKSACDYPIASLNTFWFTVGWCVFFYVPSIIFAVKLAKYYRIMDDEAPYRAPKSKKKKKKDNRRRDSEEEMALDDMDGGRDDNIRLVDNGRPTNMVAQQNPHYVHDEPILAYNDLGRPMAPPPAYNPAYPKGAPPTLPPRNFSSTFHGDYETGRPTYNYYEETPFNSGRPKTSGSLYGQPDPSNRHSISMYQHNPQYDQAF